MTIRTVAIGVKWHGAETNDSFFLRRPMILQPCILVEPPYDKSHDKETEKNGVMRNLRIAFIL